MITLWFNYRMMQVLIASRCFSLQLRPRKAASSSPSRRTMGLWAKHADNQRLAIRPTGHRAVSDPG
jgi:hypothetical protein